MKEGFDQFSDEDAIRIASLIAEYIRGTISEKDHDELDAWVEASDGNMLLFEKLTDPVRLGQSMEELEKMQAGLSYDRVSKRIRSDHKRVSKITRLLMYAAMIACIVSVSWWILKNQFRNRGDKSDPPEIQFADLPPALPRAYMAVAGGKTITLDSVPEGMVVEEAGIRFVKKGEEVMLLDMPSVVSDAIHIVSVPRGGYYKLLLSDGSHVWINAASSVSFPAKFSGGERRVRVTGEVFFDVAHDNDKPFYVEFDNTVIKVLGTRFNVNAYTDEQSEHVTLTKGLVDLEFSNQRQQLKPGQEILLDSSGRFKIRNADTAIALSWKENKFLFRNTDIRQIMRQLSRWYNVDVKYEDYPAGHFNAEISRDLPLSQILRYLEMTGEVHFMIKKDEILVKR